MSETRIRDAVESEAGDVNPVWSPEGVPMCREESCQHFDGKRCRLVGRRPDAICAPAVEAMFSMLVDRSGR